MGRKHLDNILSAVLVLATLAVYWQVRDHQFVLYDDDVYITENKFIQKGVTTESVWWAFTTGRASNWHPLTWLSLMLDYDRFGLNPSGFHLMNLLLHLINTVLLFRLLRRMTGASWESAFVAALFALHPLHVESVAWASARKDTLSMLLLLLAIRAYVQYVDRRTVWRYLSVIVLFAFGLMAKPMLVTLPFILLLLDYWPLNRWRRGESRMASRQSVEGSQPEATLFGLIKEKLPLFGLTALSGIVTLIVQQQGGALSSLERTSLGVRVSNALVSYGTYVTKTVWPSDLAVFYPHVGENLPWWQIALAASVLVLVTVLVLLEAKRRRYLPVGWFWYLGTLVPVIGLVQVGAQSMADRYTYLPLVGLFIIASWGVVDATSRWKHRRIVLTIAGSAVLLALSILTWRQVGFWKTSAALFEHALSVTDDNWLAHEVLGVDLVTQGRHLEAERHFSEALKIVPKFPLAHYNLGNALLARGELSKAIDHYNEALHLDSSQANAYLNLGIAFERRDSVERALEYFRRAVSIDPNLAGAHFNLALFLGRQRKYDQAMVHLNEVLRIDPEDREAHAELERIRGAKDTLR